MRQSAVGEGFAHGVVRNPRRGRRIAHRGFEGAQGQVGPLWHEKNVRARGADTPAAKRPDSRQSSKQRALAAARGAADQPAFACRDGQGRAGHDRDALRGAQVDMVETGRVGLVGGQRRARLGFGQGVVEAEQAVDTGFPGGQVGVGVDEP